MTMKYLTYALLTITLITTSLMTPLVFTTYAQSVVNEFKVVNTEWLSSYGATIAPGDVITLTVTLKYLGSSQVQGVLGTLELPSGIQPYGSEVAVATYNSLVTPSSPYVNLKYVLKVSPNAGTGLYTIVLELRYSELINGTWVSRCEYEYIKLLVTGRPDVEVINYSPKVLHVGTQVINLTLSNLGDYVARDLSIEVKSQLVTVINGSTYLGDLRPNENLSVLVTTYVPPTLKSSVTTLNILIKYLMPDGTWREVSKSLVMPVSSEELPRITVELLNNTLVAGEGTTYLIIKDLGGGSLSNVSITVSSNEVSTEVVSTNASSISPNQSLMAELRTYVPTKYLGTSVHLQVVINYVDDYGVARLFSKSFTLAVTDTVVPKVVVRPKSLVVSPGLSDVVLEVVNEGSEPINYLVVSTECLNYAEVVNGSVITVPHLRPHESRGLVITLKVPELDELVSTELRVSLTYFVRGIKFSESSQLRLTILPKTPTEGLRIELLNKTLKSPSVSELVFRVFNGLGTKIDSLVINVESGSSLVKVINGTLWLGSLGTNESLTTSVPVIVNYGALGTTYVEFVATYVDGLGYEHEYRVKYLVSIEDNSPKFVVTASPKVIRSGATEFLRLLITNVGGDALNTEVSISTKQGLAVLKSMPVELGDLSSGCSKSLVVPIRASEVNSLTTSGLVLSITYYDVLGSKHVSTYSLDLTIEPTTKPSMIKVSVTPKVLKSLSSDLLSIRLRALSDLSDLTLSIEDLGPLIPTEELSSKYLGNLSRGSEVVVKVPIKVPNSPGTYEGSLRLTYSVSGVKYVDTVKFSFTVVPSSGYVLITLSPHRLSALSNSSLVITIKNLLPYTLSSTYLDIELPSQLAPLGSTTYFIGNLSPNEEVSVSVPVSTPYVSAPQVGKVVTKLTYLDPLANTHVVSESFSIELIPRSTGYLRVSVGPTELVIGRENYVFLNISNPLNHLVEGVEVTLSTTAHLLLLNESRLYVGELGPNSLRSIKLLVYVPSTASTSASLIINVKYLDSSSGVINSFTTSRTLLLRGVINLTLTDVAVIPESPVPGQPFSVTLTVTNVGTSTAYAVRASALTEGLPVRTFGPKSVYVGNAEVNSPVTFTLNLMLERSAKGVVRVPIQLTYMDNLRRVHTKVFYVEVVPTKGLSTYSSSVRRSSSNQGASVPNALLIMTSFIAGVITASLITYYLMRRRVGGAR